MRTAILLPALLLLAEDKPAPPMTVIDVAGKEVKLKGWTFTEGTRKLGWLADKPDDAPPPPPKGKRPPRSVYGPEALAVRDASKFFQAEGVLALVPLSRVRSVDFDAVKGTVTVKAATDGDDAELTGTTLYKGNNKFTIEAEVDKGTLGIASVIYKGGLNMGGVRALRLTPDKAAAMKPGRAAVVEAADKALKQTYKVTDLMPLYRLEDGREVLSPTLLFKKTLRLDVNSVVAIKAGGEDDDGVQWDVTPKDGESAGLTLLSSGTIDGQQGTLLGLVGTVPFGYRLFPVRRVASIAFDAAEVPKGTLLRMPKPLPDDK